MSDNNLGTMLGLALVALTRPFDEWAAEKREVEKQLRMQRRLQRQQPRPQSPLALNLGRASHPFGFAALALVLAVLLYGGREGFEVGPFLPPPVFLSAGVGLFLLVQAVRFRVGVRRYRAFLNDPLAPITDALVVPRAFLKMAIGGGVTGFLLLHADDWRATTDAMLFAGDAAFLLGIWCLVTGAARVVLLTGLGGSALARINRHIQQTRVVMRPVRPRPWWRFW